MAGLFNSLIGALTAVVLLRSLLRVARVFQSAVLVTVAYATATLAWPYSGTFFSEPLATLFVLLSFDFALGVTQNGAKTSGLRLSLWAGLTLGLAFDAHITAILLAPFWVFVVMSGKIDRRAIQNGLFFVAGLLPSLVLVGVYNHTRFGSIVETGRGVGVNQFSYGTFQLPWRGLYGLTFGPGKGLLLFSPIVLAVVAAWPAFHRRNRPVSIAIISAAVLRMIFISSRSDWHGGFCLGPRYLVILLPILMLTAVSRLDDLFCDRKWRTLAALIAGVALCSLQQLYFSLGEIFSFLHSMKREAIVVRRENPFLNDEIYLSWRYSPLSGLLDGMPGPYLLKVLKQSNQALWLYGSVVLLSFWTIFGVILLRSAAESLKRRGSEPS